MLGKVTLFLALFAISLLLGRAFWVWLSENPKNFEAATYVSYFQTVDRAIAGPIAVIGNVALVLTAAAAVLLRADRLVLYLLLGAFLCLAASTVITVAVNIPINRQIAALNAHALSGEWAMLRDRWWAFHQLRLLSLLAAESLVFLAVLLRFEPRV